jgi:hypothetical protein
VPVDQGERSPVGSLISEPFPIQLAQSAVQSGFSGGDLHKSGSLQRAP